LTFPAGRYAFPVSGHVEILPTHTPALFRAAVERAAALLRAGEIVALPTETVYGLAANALDPAAVAKIYTAKGRPVHNPIIVHVASLEMAWRSAAQWPAAADALAAAFWPGPLTLVLPRSPEIPGIVTAGGPTVGIRWPGHPFMQEVIRACGFPLAAPSANAANALSPTNAAHVAASLGARVPLIVDGGQCQVGLESTVLDLGVTPPRVLRPGMIHEESLAAVVGPLGSAPAAGPSTKPLRSPGQLRKHYAPQARLRVLAWRDDADLRVQLAALGAGENAASPMLSGVFVLAHTRIPAGEFFGNVSVIPHDPEAFARALYAELHRCDATGARWIIVEAVPESPEWRAVADRLSRAAA
jgi:L-threonylcarbamoyladenylate synthase